MKPRAEEVRREGRLGLAVFSPCERYRYWLDRRIEQLDFGLVGNAMQLHRGSTAVFVMLNPSTADADQNDPTVRRCIGFAQRWGCTRLVVTNAFALRSTDPRALYKADDPVGPRNLEAIKTAVEVARGEGDGPIVVAWGSHGGLHDHDETVLGWIEAAGGQPLCLGTTARGNYPRHPLYLENTAQLRPYPGRLKGTR